MIILTTTLPAQFHLDFEVGENVIKENRNLNWFYLFLLTFLDDADSFLGSCYWFRVLMKLVCSAEIYVTKLTDLLHIFKKDSA